ncbi:MAG: hypothetical protein U9Q82_07235 [Chloroflexota bacterium]|nr:hypothetical protein [Chloroflexota bacterium]
MKDKDIPRKKLDIFNKPTNESEDGKTIFLPTGDEEWLELLRTLLYKMKCAYEDSLERMRKNAENGKFEWPLTPYLIATSANFYRIEILEALLREKSINKDTLREKIRSEQDEYDDAMFQEAWRNILRFLSMVAVYEHPDKKIPAVLKIGKPTIRSWLDDDNDFTKVGEGYTEYINMSSDYLF